MAWAASGCGSSESSAFAMRVDSWIHSAGRRMLIRPTFAAVAALLCLLPADADQSGRPQEPKQSPQATIRAEVALVNVVFTAADRQNRPVLGL